MTTRTGVRAGASAIAVAALMAAPAGAVANTKTVYAGVPPSAANAFNKVGAEVDAFFGPKVTINKGDSVKWIGLAANFHTVDIPPKGGSDLPLFVAHGTITGAKDAAGNPFWFSNGNIPTSGFNPALFAPTGGHSYDGSARIDSPLPLGPPSGPFTVKFTKAGTYKYFCDTHYGMVGTVVVLQSVSHGGGKADVATSAKKAPKPPKVPQVPSAKQDAKLIAKQVAKDLKEAKKLAKSKVAAGKVLLGEAGPGGVEVLAMFPATLTVKTGSVVTFSMSKDTHEVHTATFGTKAYLKTLADSLAGTAIDQAALYPSSPPASGPIELTPTSHGNGFANTGALDEDSTTPVGPSGQIKFSTPGTYRFICIIHPLMTGTITVK
jgi:plastocyanin